MDNVKSISRKGKASKGACHPATLFMAQFGQMYTGRVCKTLFIPAIIVLALLIACSPPGGDESVTLPMPVGVTVLPGDGFVDISWNAPDTGGMTITKYTVYWGTESGVTKSSISKKTTSDNTSTSLRVDGLTNGTTYYFVVTATYAAGESDESDEKSASPTEQASATYPDIIATVNTAIATASPTLGNNTWTGEYTASELPAGLTINPDTGAITGKPTAIASEKTFIITMTGKGNSTGINGTVSVTITVNPKSIESVTYTKVIANAGVLIANPLAPTVVPADATVTYALSQDVSLPGGLNLDTNGAISGTPQNLQAEQTYSITVTGTGDWQGTKKTVDVSITIEAASQISATYTPFTVTIDDTIIAQRPASTTPSELTADYALAAGVTLPSGLTLNTDGSITGTATAITAQNTYRIELTGTGSHSGKSGTAQVTITVNPKSIDSVTYEDILAVYDTDLTAGVSPTKAPSGLTATYASPDLPEGLQLDQDTGEITGKPTGGTQSATEANIAVTGVGDWEGATFSATVSITITAKNLADMAVAFTVPATDIDVLAGTGGSSSLTISNDGGLSDADYVLSITGPSGVVAAVTIKYDGTITIGSAIATEDSGEYTITATGTGGYTGSKEAGKINIWANTLPEPFELIVYNYSAIFIVEDANTNSTINIRLRFNTNASGYYRGQTADITDFKIYWGTTSGFTLDTAQSESVTINDKDENTATIENITPGQRYYIVVCRKTDAGKSSPTRELFVKTGGGPQYIDISTSLHSTAYGDTPWSIDTNIIWNSNSNHRTYEFSILEESFTDETGLTMDSNGYYTGKATKLLESKPYTLVLAEPSGNWENSFPFPVRIIPKDFANLPDFTMTVFDTTLPASSGGTIQVGITLPSEIPHNTMQYGTDYTLSIDKGGTTISGVTINANGEITILPGIDKSNAGKYSVKATGTGNYTGNKSVEFNLTLN